MSMIFDALITMPRVFFTKVDKYFKLKPDSVGEPDIYLVSKVRLIKLENGVWAWELNPSQYVQESCRNVHNDVKDNLCGIWKSPKQAPNPFAMGYTPEFYASTVLDTSLASYYKSQKGFLIWMVELG